MVSKSCPPRKPTGKTWKNSNSWTWTPMWFCHLIKLGACRVHQNSLIYHCKTTLFKSYKDRATDTKWLKYCLICKVWTKTWRLSTRKCTLLSTNQSDSALWTPTQYWSHQQPWLLCPSMVQSSIYACLMNRWPPSANSRKRMTPLSSFKDRREPQQCEESSSPWSGEYDMLVFESKNMREASCPGLKCESSS